MSKLSSSLQERLTDLVGTYGVPGASLAVWAGGELSEASAGVVNLETGVAATNDTLFQIGSITKLYTSALCMQLVEEGKLSLDEPVRKWLPDFKVANADVTARVTLRHLLTHTSGIEGDYFKDAGRGEDRIARFVGMLGGLPQVHPIDAMFSYCNTGFVIAGRLIEIAGGQLWDKAIRNRIAKPIGTPSFSTLPEQALRYLTAIGHLGAPGALGVTPLAYLAQSNAPAGSMSMTRARDVITFARMMMGGGIGPNGTSILSEASVRAMHEMNVACPTRMNIDAIGLATFLWDWDGDGRYEIFGHDGSTIGQAAWLRYHPESGVAVALLTNGGNGKGLAQALLTDIFSTAAGIKPPSPPVATPDFAYNASAYEGRYANVMEIIEVTAENGRLIATTIPSANAAVISGVRRVPLDPVDGELFVGVVPGFTEATTYHFLDRDGDGRPRFLHCGVRAHKRLEA
ncbi:MAG: serine hydrolase domain-containing protein [Parvibaculum sp.]|uniref:serine hydrolase domain-containing protein n=1 Tax=Parvibaculum sp. TaxID=2024848 RepID=UPI003C79591E